MSDFIKQDHQCFSELSEHWRNQAFMAASCKGYGLKEKTRVQRANIALLEEAMTHIRMAAHRAQALITLRDLRGQLVQLLKEEVINERYS